MSFIKNAIVCYQALAINLFGFAVRRPALVTGPLTFQNSESNNRTVMDILKDGFLLAAPKRKVWLVRAFRCPMNVFLSFLCFVEIQSRQ